MKNLKKAVTISLVAGGLVAAGAGAASADAGAHGAAVKSPGVASGNLVQVPVHVPVNVVGDSRQRDRPAQPGLRQHRCQPVTPAAA